MNLTSLFFSVKNYFTLPVFIGRSWIFLFTFLSIMAGTANADSANNWVRGAVWIGIDHNWSKPLLIGHDPSVVWFVTAPTSNGGNDGVVRLRNTTKGPQLKYQEWSYLDGAHYALEQVGVMGLQQGVWVLGTQNDVHVSVDSFELGGSPATWKTVNFQQTFEGIPQVILTSQTALGGSAFTLRLRNITRSSMQVALFEEESFLNPLHQNYGHVQERIGFLVVYSPRNQNDINGITLSLPHKQGVNINHSFKKFVDSYQLRLVEDQSQDAEIAHVNETLDLVQFNNMIFSQVSSYIGPDPITIRSAAQPRCAELKDYAALFGGVTTSSCAIKRNRNVYVNTLLHYNITQSSLLSSALDHTLTDFELENQLVSTIVSSLTLGGLVDMAFEHNGINTNGLVDNTTTSIDLLKNWKNPQVHQFTDFKNGIKSMDGKVLGNSAVASAVSTIAINQLYLLSDNLGDDYTKGLVDTLEAVINTSIIFAEKGPWAALLEATKFVVNKGGRSIYAIKNGLKARNITKDFHSLNIADYMIREYLSYLEITEQTDRPILKFIGGKNNMAINKPGSLENVAKAVAKNRDLEPFDMERVNKIWNNYWSLLSTGVEQIKVQQNSEPVIHQVIIPNNIIKGSRIEFEVRGAYLTDRIVFNLQDCPFARLQDNGTGNSRKFSCTVTATGGKAGEIIDGHTHHSFVVQVKADTCFKTIQFNQTVAATWGSDCLSVNRSGSYARFFSFNVDHTLPFSLGLFSELEDGYVYLLRGEGKDGKILLENDDFNEDMQRSFLETTLEPGVYTVEATTFFPDSTGNFSLTLRDDEVSIFEPETQGKLLSPVQGSQQTGSVDFQFEVNGTVELADIRLIFNNHSAQFASVCTACPTSTDSGVARLTPADYGVTESGLVKVALWAFPVNGTGTNDWIRLDSREFEWQQDSTPSQAGKIIQKDVIYADDPSENLQFGSKVGISGDVAYVTSENSNTLYIFERLLGAWSQTKKIIPTNPKNKLSSADIELHNNVIAILFFSYIQENKPKIYRQDLHIYELNNGIWELDTIPLLGAAINAENRAMSLYNNRIARCCCINQIMPQ